MGECRSRTAATVAGTPGLQRADAAPELGREDAGPQVAQSPLRVAARRAAGGGGGGDRRPIGIQRDQ